MNIVETARLGERHVHEPGRENREAGLLDAHDDLARHARGHRVGLDDGEGALRAHRPITLAMVAPMSAGLLPRVAPASSSAFIFSAAVPLPPAMIAGGKGTAAEKMKALEEAGATLGKSPADMGATMAKVIGR